MLQQPHHRSVYRKGSPENLAGKRAEEIAKLSAPGRVLERLIVDARPVGINTFYIPGGAALILRAKTVLDDWRPLANDTEGEVFQ